MTTEIQTATRDTLSISYDEDGEIICRLRGAVIASIGRDEAHQIAVFYGPGGLFYRSFAAYRAAKWWVHAQAHRLYLLNRALAEVLDLDEARDVTIDDCTEE